MSGPSFFQISTGGGVPGIIGSDCTAPLLGDKLKDDATCCVVKCGCYCVSFIVFSGLNYGTCGGSYAPPGYAFHPGCNYADALCIKAGHSGGSGIAGGACESPKTGCHYSRVAYLYDGVLDYYDQSSMPVLLFPTGGWVHYYSGPGRFGFPIVVWLNVSFQQLEQPPSCTGPLSIGGAGCGGSITGGCCCCDGTNFPCNPLTNTRIPINCDDEPTFSTDWVFPTPDTTHRCQPPTGDYPAC